MMRAIEIFRKLGYRQRYREHNTIIYDLKKKEMICSLPETIIFGSERGVDFSTDNIDNYNHLGTFSFNIDKELLMAINMQIKEIEEKKSIK